MFGNMLTLNQFTQWLNHFKERDEIKPTVKQQEYEDFTWFELYRGGRTMRFVETKAYRKSYIKRLKKSGKIDMIFDAI